MKLDIKKDVRIAFVVPMVFLICFLAGFSVFAKADKKEITEIPSSTEETEESFSDEEESEAESAEETAENAADEDGTAEETAENAADEANLSFVCGDGYTYNPSTGVLSIWTNEAAEAAPWSQFSDEIEYVSIGANVTELSTDAFSAFDDGVQFCYAGTEEAWEEMVSEADDAAWAENVMTGAAALSYPGSYSGDDAPLVLYFSDEDLSGSGYTFSGQTAVYAMGLEFAGWSSDLTQNDYAEEGEVLREQNLTALFGLLGFENIFYSGYDAPLSDASDKAAFAIAEKTIGSGENAQTLVAVVVRGGCYGGEWCSNMHVGTGAYHEGFYQSALLVDQALQDYLAENTAHDDSVRLLFTGYSRGAAVANAAASLMEENLPGTMTADQLTAYCFACPAVVDTTRMDIQDPVYENIFCINNTEDVIPRLPFGELGYERFGITMEFPSEETDEEGFVRIYHALTCQNLGTTESIDDVFSGGAWDELSGVFANAVGSAENYTSNFEGGIMDLIRISCSGLDTPLEDQLAEYYGQKEWGKACQAIRTRIPRKLSKMAAMVESNIEDTIVPLFAACYLNGASVDDLADFLEDLITGILNNSDLTSQLLKSFDMDDTSSLSSILSGHAPLLYLAGLVSTYCEEEEIPKTFLERMAEMGEQAVLKFSYENRRRWI